MRTSTPVLLLAALLVGAQPARAQESQPVKVTPFIAFGTAGAPPVGVLVTVPLTTTLSAEIEVAYGRGAGDIHAMSSSLSLLQNLPKVGRLTPYIAGGIGVSQFGAPVLAPLGPPIGTVSRLAFTLNAGAGLKVPLRSGLDFRTDVRYFDSLGKGSDQFRIANGISFDTGRGRKP